MVIRYGLAWRQVGAMRLASLAFQLAWRNESVLVSLAVHPSQRPKIKPSRAIAVQLQRNQAASIH